MTIDPFDWSHYDKYITPNIKGGLFLHMQRQGKYFTWVKLHSDTSGLYLKPNDDC